MGFMSSAESVSMMLKHVSRHTHCVDRLFASLLKVMCGVQAMLADTPAGCPINDDNIDDIHQKIVTMLKASMEKSIYTMVPRHSLSEAMLPTAVRCAHALLRLESFAESIDVCQGVLPLCSHNTSHHASVVIESLLIMGQCLYHQHRHKEALEHYEQALALSLVLNDVRTPTTAICFGFVAKQCEGLGRYERAIDAYESALAIRTKMDPGQPNTAVAMANYARALGRVGHKEMAQSFVGICR
jgi:tetratricopeptide (TPR) repeat protein